MPPKRSKVSDAAIKQLAARKRKADAKANKTLAHTMEGIANPPVPTVSGPAPLPSMTTRALAYELPAAVSIDKKRAFFMYLILCLRSETSKDRKEYSNLLYTWFHALFRSMIAPLLNVHYDVEIVSNKDLDRMVKRMDAGAQTLKDSVEDAKAKMKAMSLVKILTFLPVSWICAPIAYSMAFDHTALYGILGMICFCLHKDAAGSGSEALKTSRYNALMKKYSLDVKDYPYYGPLMGATTKGLTELKVAWANNPILKKTVFTELIKFSGQDTTLEQDYVFLFVRLMRWSDLSHIPIITEALNMYPGLDIIPQLRPSLIAYKAGVNQMRMMCPDLLDASGGSVKDSNGAIVKDISAMPFLKLISGDKKSIAQRDTMLPLLAVSVYLLCKTKEKLRQYAKPQGYDSLEQEVERTLEAMEERSRELEDKEDDSGSETE